MEEIVEKKIETQAQKKLLPILNAIDSEKNLTREGTSNKPPHYMSTEDMQYIERCIAKHGNNIQKMFMDIVSLI